MPKTETKTRTVLRYKLDFDKDGIACIGVGANPVLRHAGTGTSPTVCAWVEVDAGTENMAALTFVSVATGAPVPEGGEYVAMFAEIGPTGAAIRHLYRTA